MGLLLSVICCIALILVEGRLQERDWLTLQSTTHCDHLGKEILRKVRQDYERWQVNKGSHSGDDWNQVRSELALAQLGERRSAEREAEVQTPAGPTLRVFK